MTLCFVFYAGMQDKFTLHFRDITMYTHVNLEIHFLELKVIYIYFFLVSSGVMIRQELDFQTQVRVLASTTIQLEMSATKKTQKNHGRHFEWMIIEVLLATICDLFYKFYELLLFHEVVFMFNVCLSSQNFLISCPIFIIIFIVMFNLIS